jgi:hypothetical protein
MLGEVLKVTAVMGKLRNEKLHKLYSARSNHIKKGKMEGTNSRHMREEKCIYA